jgi:uncharacterized membrane protein YphA (DoxX/SURF4 family)
MNTLGSLLTWVAEYGYVFVLAGLLVVLCIRYSEKRLAVLRVFLIVGGIIVGSIFLAAAYGKMKPLPGFSWSWSSVRISISLFAMQVESYQVLTSRAANAVAHFLPYCELLLGLWLVSGFARRYSSLVASLALCGFMIAIASAYFRGLKIDCGCGIGPPEEAGPAALARDGLKFLLPTLLVMIGSFWIRRKPAAQTLAPVSAAAVQAD